MSSRERKNSPFGYSLLSSVPYKVYNEINYVVTEADSLDLPSGVGGGAIITMTLIIISDIVSLRDRGKFQGINEGIIAISNGVGPVLGGAFSEYTTVSPHTRNKLCIPLMAHVTVAMGLLDQPSSGWLGDSCQHVAPAFEISTWQRMGEAKEDRLCGIFSYHPCFHSVAGQ
jgi:MFS family permease